MTLNASGPISLAGSTAGQSIAVELGQSATGQISLNDSAVRTLAGVASGAIIMPTNFYGKSNIVTGQITYSTPGTYTWVAPTGVSSVSVLIVGKGGLGGRYEDYCCCGTGYRAGGGGGGGGGLGYVNSIPVTAGSSYTVFLSSATYGQNYFISAATMYARNGQDAAASSPGGPGNASVTSAYGTNSVQSGGFGGYPDNGPATSYRVGGGGGGAAGYSNSGGNGSNGNSGLYGQSSAGGGGGGGGGGSSVSVGGGGGGGVGIAGTGTSGSGGGYGGYGGGGGSGGANGGSQSAALGGGGGLYGGGGGGDSGPNTALASGGSGAIRIIWPGNTRTYPSNAT